MVSQKFYCVELACFDSGAISVVIVFLNEQSRRDRFDGVDPSCLSRLVCVLFYRSRWALGLCRPLFGSTDVFVRELTCVFTLTRTQFRFVSRVVTIAMGMFVLGQW